MDILEERSREKRLTCSLQVVSAVATGLIPEVPARGGVQPDIGVGAEDAGQSDLPSDLEGCAGKATGIGCAGTEASEYGSLGTNSIAGCVCCMTHAQTSALHDSCFCNTCQCMQARADTQTY